METLSRPEESGLENVRVDLCCVNTWALKSSKEGAVVGGVFVASTEKLISLSVFVVKVKVGKASVQVFSLDISQHPTYFMWSLVLNRDTSRSG